MKPAPLLKVSHLQVRFPPRTHAVQGVSFEIFEGEKVGVIGESGSGKTSMVHAVTGLLPKALLEGGVVSPPLILGKEIGMVFQDPMTSLNPTMKVLAQVEEGMRYHRRFPKNEVRQRARDLLSLVGVVENGQYPHELSGGQRQRVAIAIALSCAPKLLIADEPTTALDVITEANILFLLQQLGMSLLLISHNLSLIFRYCQKVLVFFAGKIVEQGSVEEVFGSPQHPYTQRLLS